MARTRREKVPTTFESLVAYLTRRPHVWRRHYIPGYDGPATFLHADLLGDLHFKGVRGGFVVAIGGNCPSEAAASLEFLPDGFAVRSGGGRVHFQYLAEKEGQPDAS